MGSKNQTDVSHFFLLGLTDDPRVKPVIFYLFLFMYMVTILGNLLIILAVSSYSYLQTPMYFFISNLSFNDICLTTTVIPNMLLNTQTQIQSISYAGCLTQVCLVLFFAGFESCILSAMAYDRYVAICYPLSYTVIMSSHLCGLIILFSVLISILNMGLLGLMVLRLSFCTNLDIPLFFCELSQVMKLACSDTLVHNILIYLATFIFGGIPISGIIFSYVQIASSVLKIPSVRGRYKVFSTCSSHLSVTSLSYGSGLWVYINSAVNILPSETSVACIMYTVVPQMLNPFIFSLRNKDMKRTMKKFISIVPSL
ncbi:olfactory receptor 7G2-like [Peromyscus californicus insignis]|uniref:olfactory receptor 7G2-like n=1 Tax=Peromyscus californicus insignis TaxID=564181 RepID=UPI0022A7306A|nr:olfactory receptor 7G2-like [Peromyscus californicus insignis]